MDKDIERIYELLEELKLSDKEKDKKINELEKCVAKLQKEMESIPKVIEDKNQIQTLEIEKMISGIELQYSKGFGRYVITFALGVISALVIKYIVK